MNDASAARLPVSLEGSLRRLQTDYLDIYLYHVPPAEGEAERAAERLLKLKREGKVRAVGISTSEVAICRRLLALGLLDVVQYAHSLIQEPRDMIQFQKSAGVGGIVRGAFASGRLSGKYFRAPPRFADDDIRRNWFPPDEAARAEAFARYAVFERWVTPARSMAQLALRWVLDEPATHTVIIGAKSIEDYATAIAATEIPPLSPSEREGIAAEARRLV